MLTRTLFLKMADSAALRGLVEKRGWRFASRFVAGSTLEAAVASVQSLNRAGILGTLSHLGEHITDAERATAEVEEFVRAISALSRDNVKCGISIKPSQMGMFIDTAMAESGIREVTRFAAEHGRFIRLDMEDSSWTDTILNMVRTIHTDLTNIGVVLQSYLRRCASDVRSLNESGVSVRLCKGAYNEPASVAFPQKSRVDEEYLALSSELLQHGVHPAFATHDSVLIEKIEALVKERDRNTFEFQMLYGVRRTLQQNLAKRGYRVRVYVPYGTEWYPYFMRRLAERPANIGFIVRNLFKG